VGGIICQCSEIKQFGEKAPVSDRIEWFLYRLTGQTQKNSVSWWRQGHADETGSLGKRLSIGNTAG
jgi:hypothetical protein